MKKKPISTEIIKCILDIHNKKDANLKGLGHAILGNFSIDQIVIELTSVNIKITAQNYSRTLAKHRKDKKERGWIKLESIEVDCIWINVKNVGLRLCQFIHVSNFHKHSWKVILSYYVAMIL